MEGAIQSDSVWQQTISNWAPFWTRSAIGLLGGMFAHHGVTEQPAFSVVPPEDERRPPKPVPKRRWSIGRLEALFRAPAGEPKPTSLVKQRSHDRDFANGGAQRRPMTRWSSAPAASTVWRHGRQFQTASPLPNSAGGRPSILKAAGAPSQSRALAAQGA